MPEPEPTLEDVDPARYVEACVYKARFEAIAYAKKHAWSMATDIERRDTRRATDGRDDLTESEAAARMGLPIHVLVQWRTRGRGGHRSDKIPHRVVDGQVLYASADVDGFR